MREEIIYYILCLVCKATDFELIVSERNAREIRVGKLLCRQCGSDHQIEDGILDLMPNPDLSIKSEQSGWVELLGETSEELIETMLKLPHFEDDPLWVMVAKNFNQITSHLDFTGKSVLDVGAGRCWSTRHLVRCGVRYAMGLDILRERFIGLETADIYLEHDDIHFDRVIGDMNDLPLRQGSFDVVFMIVTLYHTSDPGKVMSQLAEVLVSGGIVIAINEFVNSLFQSNNLEGCVEIEHGINENVYSIRQYILATCRAGLKPVLLFPESIWEELNRGDPIVRQTMGLFGYHTISQLWRYQRGQSLVMGFLLSFFYLLARMPLVLIVQKETSA